jgi:triacylglycerol lipase
MQRAQEGTMSFLVKLPIERYARDAFAQFADRPTFDIGNAKAMAWMCQLAYETDEPDKIAKILTDRGFTLLDGGVLIREAKTVLPMADTHCFLARHNQTGTTIVAFAGTDPLSLANWVSDFNARLDRKTGAAEGYQGAADAVTNDLRQLLARSVPQGGKVIVTGHSLGGAIAALIAARIDAEHPGSVDAVYTYGMPRPGGQGLVDSYNAAGLGMHTYRMVHGHDIVPTVAPSSFGFLHPGRVLTCERLAKVRRVRSGGRYQFGRSAVRGRLRSECPGAPQRRGRRGGGAAHADRPAEDRREPFRRAHRSRRNSDRDAAAPPAGAHARPLHRRLHGDEIIGRRRFASNSASPILARQGLYWF